MAQNVRLLRLGFALITYSTIHKIVINGHCSGTIYSIKKINSHVTVQLTNTNFVLRTSMMPSVNQFPFQYYDMPFPIILVLSFMVNKFRGQILDRVGAFLSSPLFTHGHLYVMISSATDLASLKINCGQTENILYKEFMYR